MMANAPKVTLLFLLYNASRTVEQLLDRALSQVHPDFKDQKDWLKIRFADDCSRDDTLVKLQKAHEAKGSPAHVEIIRNPKNLGLAGSLNHHLKQIETPYVLTCHLDCFFAETDYITRMLWFMEEDSKIAVVTGKPVLDPKKTSYIEKINTIVNMMDVLPLSTESTLASIGFAEGRCDLFRHSALKEVGFYPTELRTSGEDQLLAIRFREKGYTLNQALQAHYELSVSEDQNSLKKIITHTHLFGRTSPAILKRGKPAMDGLSLATGGYNRFQRKKLRRLQILHALNLFGMVFLGLPALWLLGPGILTTFLAMEVILLFAKHLLLRPYFRFIGLGLTERAQVFFVFYAIDLAYFFGFVEGALKTFTLKSGESIS